MFTLAATPVKFVALLVLFAWCTAWGVYELTRPQDGRQRVSNVLHLVMSVVMLLMVAGPTWDALTAIVPSALLVGVFAASTLWFVWLSVDAFRGADRRGGLHFAGHAAMFGAMTWHLSAMAVMERAMSGGMTMGGHDSGTGHGMGGGMATPRDMGQAMEQARQPGGTLWIFAVVGIPLMAYLLAASVVAVRNLVRPRAAVNDDCPCGEGCACGPDCACSTAHAPVQAVERELVVVGAAAPASASTVTPATSAHSCHEARPVGSTKYRLAALSDFAMNFGMFWMSTGLLVAVLPFFALFAF